MKTCQLQKLFRIKSTHRIQIRTTHHYRINICIQFLLPIEFLSAFDVISSGGKHDTFELFRIFAKCFWNAIQIIPHSNETLSKRHYRHVTKHARSDYWTRNAKIVYRNGYTVDLQSVLFSKSHWNRLIFNNRRTTSKI